MQVAKTASSAKRWNDKAKRVSCSPVSTLSKRCGDDAPAQTFRTGRRAPRKKPFLARSPPLPHSRPCRAHPRRSRLRLLYLHVSEPMSAPRTNMRDVAASRPTLSLLCRPTCLLFPDVHVRLRFRVLFEHAQQSVRQGDGRFEVSVRSQVLALVSVAEARQGETNLYD